tara:strand:- start:59 stop:646 length:588 start_codon:yes stop_codon:yes gene_type:complete
MAFIGCDNQYNSVEAVKVPMESKNYSDLIEFQILPPTGSEEIEAHGNTLELLSNIPYLFSSGVIPSIKVINEVLAKGLSDSGMSGGLRWTPYYFDPNSFNELVAQLKTSEHYKSLEYIEPDSWVQGFEDWNVWVMYIKKGIPWKQHKKLNDIVVKLEFEMKEANASGDDQRVNELHFKTIEAGTSLSEFVMEHLK